MYLNWIQLSRVNSFILSRTSSKDSVLELVYKGSGESESCSVVSNSLKPHGIQGGLPCVSTGKKSACNEGDLGSIPGLGRSPGEGKGYPLQYSGLENSMDCIVHGVTKNWTLLSDFQIHRTIESMELSRPEYWSAQPFPSPGDLPKPEIEPRSSSLQADSLPVDPQGKPKSTGIGSLSLLQRILLTQESNRGLLHCRWILYQLSYQGSWRAQW